MRQKAIPIDNAAALPILQVTWEDAELAPAADADVTLRADRDGFGSLPVCQDVGFLVRWNSREIVLAVSRCQEDNVVRHSNTIPRSLILRIDVLSGELPCPMTALIPAKMASRKSTSRHGSSHSSEQTLRSTTANSSTPHPKQQSKP